MAKIYLYGLDFAVRYLYTFSKRTTSRLFVVPFFTLTALNMPLFILLKAENSSKLRDLTITYQIHFVLGHYLKI